MFARLLALVCLLNVGMVVGHAASANADLVVYLRTQPDSAAEPLAAMKEEVTALMRQAGFRMEWRILGTQRQQEDVSRLIVAELRGVCRAPAPGKAGLPLEHSVSLASSAVVDGQVLPFSWVDCSVLSRFIGPPLARESKARRDYIYGRAMARLLAHEFYHIVVQTGQHTNAGIGKPAFTVNDLLTERFEFEEAALARLRPPADVAQTPTEDEALSER